jgi:hypothetical protein
MLVPIKETRKHNKEACGGGGGDECKPLFQRYPSRATAERRMSADVILPAFTEPILELKRREEQPCLITPRKYVG